MTQQKPKKNPFFGKIESKEEALKMIKECTVVFMVVGAIQIVLGYFFIGMEYVIDGAVYIVLALLLRKFNSRIIAVLLLILTIASVVVTAMNALKGSGGSNIYLALAMVYGGVRGLQATIVINKSQITAHHHE